MSFSAEALFHSAELLLGIDSDKSTPSYRNDGSRKQTRQPEGSVLPSGEWQPNERQIDPVLMQVDLRALHDLQERHNINLFIYESPLHPKARLTNSRHHEIRKLFLRTCTQFDLECISAPSLNEFKTNEKWSDWTHAPETLLATWLKTKVIDRMTDRGSSR